MALTTNEGTLQSTMDILSERIKIPIRYARIFAYWKTRDNYPGGAFLAVLDCFITDAPDPLEETGIHYEIGCNIPESEIKRMAACDDRDVLYPHIEYTFQLQQAEENRASGGILNLQAERDKLKELQIKLGISSLLQLPDDEHLEEETR